MDECWLYCTRWTGEREMQLPTERSNPQCGTLGMVGRTTFLSPDNKCSLENLRWVLIFLIIDDRRPYPRLRFVAGESFGWEGNGWSAKLSSSSWLMGWDPQVDGVNSLTQHCLLKLIRHLRGQLRMEFSSSEEVAWLQEKRKASSSCFVLLKDHHQILLTPHVINEGKHFIEIKKI